MRTPGGPSSAPGFNLAAAAPFAVAALFAFLSAACDSSGEPARLDPATVAAEAEKAHAGAAADRQTQLVARGRAVYQSVCIACHNADPHKPGSLGPDVWGSSLELLRARVIYGTYPPGYHPKRPTGLMRPLPQVQADLPALQAFLNSN